MVISRERERVWERERVSSKRNAGEFQLNSTKFGASAGALDYEWIKLLEIYLNETRYPRKLESYFSHIPRESSNSMKTAR